MASAATLNRRVYLAVEEGDPGTVRMRLSLHPPKSGGAMAALLSRGMMLGEELVLQLVSDPAANPALRGEAGPAGPAGPVGAKGDAGPRGLPGTTAVADVTLTQTATVAIVAGVRRLTVTVPAAAGLVASDAIMVAPTGAVPNGYAIHDARAVSSTSIQIALTAPALAINASYSIALRVFRLG